MKVNSRPSNLLWICMMKTKPDFLNGQLGAASAGVWFMIPFLILCSSVGIYVGRRMAGFLGTGSTQG